MVRPPGLGKVAVGALLSCLWRSGQARDFHLFSELVSAGAPLPGLRGSTPQAPLAPCSARTGLVARVAASWFPVRAAGVTVESSAVAPAPDPGLAPWEGLG